MQQTAVLEVCKLCFAGGNLFQNFFFGCLPFASIFIYSSIGSATDGSIGGDKCLGIFYARRALSPDDAAHEEEKEELDDDISLSDSEEEEELRANAKRKGKAKKQQSVKRGNCYICGRQTPYVCHGCHHTLCNQPAKREVNTKAKKKKATKRKQGGGAKGGKSGKASFGGGGKKAKTAQNKPKKKKEKKHFPAVFCTEVPKTRHGKLVRDRGSNPIFVKEYGEYTCYHIAHRHAWKKYLFSAQQAVVAQIAERIEGTPTNKEKKRKKSKV